MKSRKGADREMMRVSLRAKLERLLHEAIEVAEQIGEPDIAEIVCEALEELEHHATTWKSTNKKSREAVSPLRGVVHARVWQKPVWTAVRRRLHFWPMVSGGPHSTLASAARPQGSGGCWGCPA